MNSVSPRIARIEVPFTLNPATLDRLCAHWESLRADPPQLVVLESTSDGFCQGMDLHWLAEPPQPEDLERLARRFAGLLQDLRTAPWVTLAVVRGAVTGGGVGLCAACDLVVAEAGSSFRLPEIMLGLTPGVILPALLYRLRPQVIAKMAFSARQFDCQTALQCGLIDDIVPAGQLPHTLREWIDGCLSGKPQAVAAFKHLLATIRPNEHELEEAGVQLLLERVQDPTMQTRLANLAFFDQL